jgi:dolichol-phosphate mannosyltransferase
MLSDKTVIAVIPAYNVQDQIARTVEGIPTFVDFIVVVDDCSKDKTSEVVAQIEDNRLILLKTKANEGVGGATVNGLLKGVELGGDIFVKVDGDDQMDTGKMEELITPLFHGYDYAKANRFLHSKELGTMPTFRLIGNFLLTFLTKIASGYWNIFDPQNGYFAITRDELKILPLDKLHKRYFFENDILINLNINRAKVCDVPIRARYAGEKSSLKIKKILISFPPLLTVRFLRRVYKKYILHDFSVIGFFYMVGLILMTFGCLFGAYHWFKSVWIGQAATTGTVMIAVLPIILGFQLFLQAIVIEIQEIYIS